MNCGNFMTIVIHSCTSVNGSMKYYAYKLIITLKNLANTKNFLLVYI